MNTAGDVAPRYSDAASDRFDDRQGTACKQQRHQNESTSAWVTPKDGPFTGSRQTPSPGGWGDDSEPSGGKTATPPAGAAAAHAEAIISPVEAYITTQAGYNPCVLEYMEGEGREKFLRRCLTEVAAQGSEGSRRCLEEVATQGRFATEVTSLCSRVKGFKGRVPPSYLGTPPGYIGTPPVPSPSYLGTPPVPSPSYLGTPPEPAAQEDDSHDSDNNNNDDGDNNNGDDDNHQGAAPADNVPAPRQPPIERGSVATIAHSAADCGLPQCRFRFFQRIPLKIKGSVSM